MFEIYISDLLEYCHVKWYDLTNKLLGTMDCLYYFT